MHGANAIISLRLKRWCGARLQRTSYDQFHFFLLNLSFPLPPSLPLSLSTPTSFHPCLSQSRTAWWILATIIISLCALADWKVVADIEVEHFGCRDTNTSFAEENETKLLTRMWANKFEFELWCVCVCLCVQWRVNRRVPQPHYILNCEHIYLNNSVTFAQLYADIDSNNYDTRSIETQPCQRMWTAVVSVCVCVHWKTKSMRSAIYFYYFSIWYD